MLLLRYVLPFCISLIAATELSYTIPEEREVGYIVGKISDDADFNRKYTGQVLAELRYALLKPSDYYTIQETSSLITTLKRMDRELICPNSKTEPCVHQIDVIVTPMRYIQIIKVTITIQDINDNSPVFPQPVYDIIIPESTPINTTYDLLVAEDLDSAEFDVSYYELEATTQAFSIQFMPSTSFGGELVLVVSQALDRERVLAYNLKLVARDRGQPPRSGMMMLNISIGDENDNTPVFEQPLYSVRVPESTEPGIMLTRVKATDLDAGLNGQVTYSISQRSSQNIRQTFRVDANTGEIFLKSSLDYEMTTGYLIPIVAADSGALPRTSQTLVNVSVADENDNTPDITVTTVTATAQVLENSLNGTFVAHMLVVDRDSGLGGQVTCILSSPYFVLQPSYLHEYNLVVNALLDRETTSNINVTIWCSDAGSPPRINQQSLNVEVVDANDNEPSFDRYVYYSMPIMENNPTGLQIMQVKATDKDIGRNAEIQYMLGPEQDSKSFKVNSLSGLVTAGVAFDRERQRDYTFSVLAVDNGDPALTGTAMVYVRIADDNDNAPLFNKTFYRLSVAENMPKYSFVGKITATDADAGTNADIWYRVSNASDGPFIIAHDTGILSTRVPLDREKIGGSQYQITVVATDYGTPALSSEVKVTIDVSDENDNEPFLINANNLTFTCSFETPPNTTIGRIMAADIDSGDNSKLGFFIQSGNQYQMFFVDRYTGDVRVETSIDYTMIGVYRLQVGIYDCGLPPHTIFTTITIQVTKEKYVPASSLVREHIEPVEKAEVYNVNLIVVVVLSSMSGILSLVLIIAIVRIKRQTKLNHSYNCRTEAQKLFSNISGRSSTNGHPSCGSSWGGTTDRSSVASVESDFSSKDQGQKLMTTFSPGTQKQEVITALQSYDHSNLNKGDALDKYPKNSVLKKVHGKEPDTDSGNCDIVSVHNSTPVLSDSADCRKGANTPKSFQCRFLSGVDHKPSSISSGNNSITSSERASPARVAPFSPSRSTKAQDTSHRRMSSLSVRPDIPCVEVKQPDSDHSHSKRESSNTSDSLVYNTSLSSDQTINGDRLCARIDEIFFSEIL